MPVVSSLLYVLGFIPTLYLLAMISGGLLYASFFPINAGFLAWIALVPLCVLVQADARPRRIYLAAFVGGITFFVPAMQWMRVAHPAMYATWLLLAIVCAIYFPIAIALIRALAQRGVPLLLAAPCVWVGLEYVRAHFPTGFDWLQPLGVQHRIGFGWYFLGYTQHDFIPMIQMADLTGVYGISFVVVMVNVVIFRWLQRSSVLKHLLIPVVSRRPILGTAVTALLVAAALVYGSVRLDHPPFAEGPRLALMQSNLPQSVKMGQQEAVRKHMTALFEEAAAVWITRKPGPPPDVIVWPETTCWEDWVDVAPGVNRRQAPINWQREMSMCELFGERISGGFVYHLLGLNGLEWEADGSYWKYNSAKLINRNGSPGPRYDKMHLVPFGEYVPLQKTFPWMKTFTPYTHDYSCKPGEHWTRFPVTVGDKTFQFACVICYEDSDPTLARNYVLPSPEGPAVDFLVNISNDGWFNGTEEHEQHFAICRFRAIECRRAIARAVNMGISGIIDSDGRVVILPGPSWAESVKVAKVINAVVPIDHRVSWYALFGDWVPHACLLVVIGTFIIAAIRRSRAAT